MKTSSHGQLKIPKTIKLFIGGEFPRTESGRVMPAYESDGKTLYAHLCQASRKDFRSAVEAAEAGYKSWSGKTAYLRSQILYRMAEMLEGKREEFSTLFEKCLGFDRKKAELEVDQGIDELIYFSGFADKYQHLLGTLNPVAQPYHCFTMPDAVGTVTLIERDEFSFSKLIFNICSILVGGNSVVVLLGKECGAVLAPLAEVFATSDLPKGVVNLLTGDLDELLAVVGGHMEVKAISFQNENHDHLLKIRQEGVFNMKRIRGPRGKDQTPLKAISDFVEYKTIWHPMGY